MSFTLHYETAALAVACLSCTLCAKHKGNGKNMLLLFQSTCKCCGVNANLIHHDSSSQSTAAFLYLRTSKIHRLLSEGEAKKFYRWYLVAVILMVAE